MRKFIIIGSTLAALVVPSAAMADAPERRLHDHAP